MKSKLLLIILLALYVPIFAQQVSIETAQEMHENGVGVNELQTQLLQKIEELTLYTLQQEEIISNLNYRIQKLEQE